MKYPSRNSIVVKLRVTTNYRVESSLAFLRNTLSKIYLISWASHWRNSETPCSSLATSRNRASRCYPALSPTLIQRLRKKRARREAAWSSSSKQVLLCSIKRSNLPPPWKRNKTFKREPSRIRHHRRIAFWCSSVKGKSSAECRVRNKLLQSKAEANADNKISFRRQPRKSTRHCASQSNLSRNKIASIPRN